MVAKPEEEQWKTAIKEEIVAQEKRGKVERWRQRDAIPLHQEVGGQARVNRRREKEWLPGAIQILGWGMIMGTLSKNQEN